MLSSALAIVKLSFQALDINYLTHLRQYKRFSAVADKHRDRADRVGPVKRVIGICLIKSFERFGRRVSVNIIAARNDYIFWRQQS